MRRKRYRLPFEIVYEDDDVIVIDKPEGLLTTHTHLPTRKMREEQPTAENILNAYIRKGQLKSSKRVYLVHRLDRETSGVMMFAKSKSTADYFRDNWNEVTKKTYRALVHGMVSEDEGVFESNLQEDPDGYRVRSVSEGGRKACTEWKVLSRNARRNSTLVEVELKSGRKNQIRVHFSEAGHPIVGDVKYGGKKADRMYLRSIRLTFRKKNSDEINCAVPALFLI